MASYVVKYGSFTVQTQFLCSNISDYGPTTQNLVTEIDLPDFSLNPSSKYTFAYEQTPGNPNNVTARIASITLPTGGSISYTYTGANDGINCTDGSTMGMTRKLSTDANAWQYTRSGSGTAWTTIVLDPSSNQSVINFVSTTFSYNNSPLYMAYYETQRQVYQGASTLLATTTRCYNGYYTTCSTPTTFQGSIVQTDSYVTLPNGNSALSEVLWDGYGLATSEKDYDYGVNMGSAPHTPIVRQISSPTVVFGGYDDAYILIVASDGAGNTLSSTSFFYDQTTPATTVGTPQHQSGKNAGNLTTIATVANGATTIYRQFTYYDTGMLKTALSANTSQSATCTSNPSICTQYTYGSGSCGNSFVTSLSEPMGLARSMTYDSSCYGGVETSFQDENGKIVNVAYTDPYYWRPASTTDPLLHTTNFAYSPTTTETYLNFNGTVSTSDLLTTFDALGRRGFSQRRQGQRPGTLNFDSVQTSYGWTTTGSVTGAFTTQTMPYQGTAGQVAPTGTPGTTVQYDALGRTANVTDGAGGMVAYSYTNNDVLQSVSGTQTLKKQYEYDGLGRLSSVCEISSTLPGVTSCGQTTAATGYWTRYQYDPVGHMTGVCQNTTVQLGTDCVNNPSAGQQTRKYAYDMLSRLVSETNPETGKNGTSGTVNYTYDAACGSMAASAGDLTKRVDNAGNITCYGYDALHRMKDVGNTGPTCRHLRYDAQTPPTGVTVTNTLARVAEAYTDNCSSSKITDEWFGYDADGQVTDFYESTQHSGGFYHSVATYWANGALNSLSAMNSNSSLIFPTINYGGTTSSPFLDGEGRVKQVKASSGTNPVTSVTYTMSGTAQPIGSLTGVTYGSSDIDSFTYFTTNGRPKTYKFNINGLTDTGTLTWNTNGTLSKLVIADNLSGSTDSQTCKYTYDDLGRLGGRDASGYSVNCGSTWSQLFSYDPFGNITKSGSGSFAPSYIFPNGATTNQLVSVPGLTINHDLNGNMLNDNLSNSYTWDPNWGNPASINSTNLIYDALGRMVEQQNGSTYTQMLYSQMGETAIMNAQTLQKAFVNLPGGGTAIYNASGPTNYRHADWLGSSRVTSTSSRTVSSDMAYAPFGELYAKSGSTTDPSFTGENSDTNGGLYDFTFRELSPSMGRWVSPDPAGLGAATLIDPQSWNRYSYVKNNPLSAVDAEGLDDCYFEDGNTYPCWSYDASWNGGPPPTTPSMNSPYYIPDPNDPGRQEYITTPCTPPSGVVNAPTNCGYQGGEGIQAAEQYYVKTTYFVPCDSTCSNIPAVLVPYIKPGPGGITGAKWSAFLGSMDMPDFMSVTLPPLLTQQYVQSLSWGAATQTRVQQSCSQAAAATQQFLKNNPGLPLPPTLLQALEVCGSVALPIS
ncbi:MAG: hypothetical protein LAP86_32650 [Acidobacteriia bacterium]|nr:hypothetical protein [Terriglobia bacterium]